MPPLVRSFKKYALQLWRVRRVERANTRMLAAKLGELEARLDRDAAPRWRYPGAVEEGKPFDPLGSCLCRQVDFASPAYAAWCARFREEPRWHRKQWEYVYILQSLFERGKLAPGMRGVGFGVGKEPLAAVMASFGASVVATDMNMEGARAQGWVTTGQFATTLAELNAKHIVSDEEFARLVSYREVDMNAIPDDLGEFDFTWSSCAFEHLGTLRKGIDFVLNSAKLLKPGGVAVHTTEFNLSSNDVTIEAGHTSLYRKRDLEELAEEVSRMGCELVPLNLDPGQGALDKYVDVPPFLDSVHLRRQLEEFAVTSIGLTIVKR